MQRRRRRRRQPCALRLREYLRQFVAFMFSNVGVIGLVVGYMIAGAFIFQAIEGSSEIERVLSMARQRELAAERLWLNATFPLNVFDESLWKYNVSVELQKYQKIIVQAVRKGWDGSDDTEFYRQWSFPGSFLYSLTIITTIGSTHTFNNMISFAAILIAPLLDTGYGNIAPRTDWGKVTTMCYAMIGLPLFLLYLTNLGDVLARSFKWVYVNMCLCRGCPGVAKRRATRLRLKIQAQLGEPLDPLTSQRPDPERRRSAPEDRTRQRSSGLEALTSSGPLDERFPSGVPRGASEPCYSLRYNLESQLNEDVHPIRTHVDRRRLREDFGEEIYRQHRNVDQTDRYFQEYRGEMDQYGYYKVRQRYELPEKRYGRDFYDRFERNINQSYREIEFQHQLGDRKFFRKNRDRYDGRYYELNRYRFNDRFQGYSPEGVDRNHQNRQRIDQRDKRNCEERDKKKREHQVDQIHTESSQVMDESQYDFWRRSNNLVRRGELFQGDEIIPREEIIVDPMDNYGKFECVEHDDTADSDEFTYITIDTQNVSVPITICVVFMVGYIIFGAMLFSMWEDWDRVDGSYFCFISLTSIGFGDIVPGERIYARASRNDSTKRIDTSFILCSMYLLFGMALIAMCFNLMQEQVVQYMAAVRRVLKRICLCKCR